VRQRAVEVLPNVDAERGLRLLLAALSDEDTWIREAAANQIALRTGRKPAVVDRRAVPALVRALDDPNPTVRVMAGAALRKLTGNRWQARQGAAASEHQAVREEWRRWWKTAASDYRSVAPELARPTPRRPVRADPAPDFRLPDVDGREISRSGQRGRITLLNFWGTWCPPCLEEVPDLVKLDSLYKERGVDLIGIALAEKNGAAGLRKWTRMHGMEYRQALADDAVLEAFDDIEEVPVSVLLDGAGQIRYRWDGERDFNTFRAAIDRLLAEEAKQ
jgi:peroxiredoxin